MSAAPTLPPDYGRPGQLRTAPPPVPPRRNRWKRIVGWFAAGILALIVLIVIAVVVLLHSSKVHQYVLNTAKQKGSAAVGTNIAIGDYTLTWSGISPTLDVYRITIEGAPPHPTPPLLQVEHARVGVTVASLLHRSWYLNDMEVHHPVVRLYVDKNGNTNIPKIGRAHV